MNDRITNIVEQSFESRHLWDGEHKIPWNAPAFSARMLKEHLSQDHDLASRRRRTIEAQAQWIASHFLADGPASILDLGCGPGLYSRLLAGRTHRYKGIDFGPASIEYARREYAVPARCEFVLADVVEADFAGPHDLAMMLYGEINVFSPAHCAAILSKAHAALRRGGQLVLELQTPATVQGTGQAPASWYKAQAGLFADGPHVCLTENHWFEAEGVARQLFHVLAAEEADSRTYRSTTKAWTEAALGALLQDAGFAEVAIHEDWPDPRDAFMLLTAVSQ